MKTPIFAVYEGTLDRKKMPQRIRFAYEAFCGAKARAKKQDLPRPEMNAREFMGWWLASLKTFKGTTPTCGRIDHSKTYLWNNIEMQDMADNSREAALRTGFGQRGKTMGAKSVLAYEKETGEIVKTFPTIRETARHFGVSQRVIQFLVRGKYKSSKVVGLGLCGDV